MFMKRATFLFLAALILYSCNNDDNATTEPESDIPETDLIAERETAVNMLTNEGLVKTWKIDQAILTNVSGTFDISENFNVQDDEFRFSGGITDGSLEWRQSHRINTVATTTEETLVDHYLAPENFTFSFDAESSTALSSFNGDFTFTIIDDNSITGRIALNDNAAELEIALSTKTAADFPSVPTTLNFENVFTYNSNSIQGFAPGMIGSYSDNSLFIVNREDALQQNAINPERIIKFNLDTSESLERLFFNDDFVSKQLHIIDNELLVVGGQFINGYNTDLLNEPSSINHGIEHFCPDQQLLTDGITRHGMAVQDNDIYIIGGSLADRQEPIPDSGIIFCGDDFADIIYKWDINTQTLTEFGTLLNRAYGSRGTIVNNNLYVFGGQEYFTSGEIYDTIHIIDLGTGEIDTQQLPSPIQFSFVDKIDSLIYVAGHNDIENADGVRIGFDYTLGVFDTQTNTYTTLETNLVQENPFDTIHQICVFNDNLYVLWGSADTDNDPDELDAYDIMSVPIN